MAGVLVGRAAERAALDRLLAGAGAERGGGLLLCGEPGIGKTALLEYAVRRAAGNLRVLRTVGVETESTLAYAALHHLLLPLLDRAADLPAGQTAALAGAFGAGGAAVEPFAVAVAALGLLSAVGGDRPVLCVVDDAHWVDTPSLHALAFAGRRLAAEPVALLLAARAEGAGVDLPRLTGLPELPVTGLDPDEAAQLLPAGLAAGTRRRLITAAGGNPLALRELPATAPRGAIAGDPLPLAGELERVFADRVRGYGGDAATVLLLAAAEGLAGPVRRAAILLDADPAVLDSSALEEVAAVTGDGTAVAFRHPLIRSAAYQAASPAARREAHAALAEALAGEPDQEDRRAWHLAKAAGGPGSARAAEAAEALERSAGRAARRAGHLAAAAALERAGELDPADAARRYLAAAEAAWRGGDTGWARALLDRADLDAVAGSAERLGVQQLRGALELRAGVPADALAVLLPAATAAAAAGVEPRRVLWMLVMAREAAFNAGQPDALARIGALVRQLPLPAGSPDAVIARALGWYSDPEPAEAFTDRAQHFYAGPIRRPDEADSITAGLETLLDMPPDLRDDVDTLIVAGGMAWGIGRYPLARRLRAEAVGRARGAGAAGTLAYALEFVLPEELGRGDYATARAHAEEGYRLAVETGRVNSACVHLAYLAALAGLRGDEDEARELAARVLAGAVPRRHVHAAGIAQHALGLLALAAGRAAEALTAFDALAGGQPLPGNPSLALAFAPDAIEAAVRAGEPDRAAPLLAGYAAWAGAAGSPEAAALAARCRAMLAPPAEAGAEYAEALRRHAGTDRPFEHARTALLYGEHLRRERRRAEAREHLRIAAETFGHLGTRVWAERARQELRATGETVRRREPGAAEALTPQELQIATAVRDGGTNREVAAQLFLSPRTVDYHLRKVFQKLGITSRTELSRLL